MATTGLPFSPINDLDTLGKVKCKFGIHTSISSIRSSYSPFRDSWKGFTFTLTREPLSYCSECGQLRVDEMASTQSCVYCGESCSDAEGARLLNLVQSDLRHHHHILIPTPEEIRKYASIR